MKEALSNFVGHFVKVVFRDGNNVIVKRGKLVSVYDDFLELHTLENIILIRLSEILKISRSIEGEA